MHAYAISGNKKEERLKNLGFKKMEPDQSKVAIGSDRIG